MVVSGVAALVVVVGGYAGFKAFAGGGTGAQAKAQGKGDGGAAGKDGKKQEIVLTLAPVDLATAGPATLVQSLAVAGTVDAARQAVVRSRHAGFLSHVSKRAGDRVQMGERLGVVDSDELRLRIAEREASLKQAQAALTVAESNRAQQRSLADRGFISKAALDSTESGYVSARSAYDAAKTQMDIAKAALAETALTSPISGIIAKRTVEPGERVGAEMPVFTILDPASLEVIVPVAAERVAELKIGQKASFQLDAGGAAVDGALTRIIPTTGSAARTVETRFALPANTTVPAGAFLSGQLRLAQSAAPITVPLVFLPMIWPAIAPITAPPATFLASVPLDALRTRAVAAFCTESSTGYVLPPNVTEIRRTLRNVESLLFLAVFASDTSNVPVAPAGMTAPLLPVTGIDNGAVNFSPTPVVLLHTFDPVSNVIETPDAIVPLVAAAGPGAGFGVTDGAGRVGAGLGLGFGLTTGLIAGSTAPARRTTTTDHA